MVGMANLGNAWHIPGNPEPRGLAGMRHPGGAVVRGATVTICSGNQCQGGGNAGNQLQDGSALFFKRAADPAWQSQPMQFLSAFGNNKYFVATLPTAAFQTGDLVQYYLRIAYDDRDTTFLQRNAAFSVTTDSEASARANPFTFALEDPALKGRWGRVLDLPNVAIHTHVLPNGRVLMWGRRDRPADSLDVHECTPFVWNPADGSVTNTPKPRRADGSTVTLFCSGHAFLADGRLLVVGGHLFDGDGLSQAALYDWKTNTWAATAPMTTPAGEEVRRWYPTAVTLANGTVLVMSGSYVDMTQAPGKQTIVADLLQVWDKGTWKTIKQANGTPLNFIGLPLYPRLHLISDGRVFMSGTNDRTLLLKATQPGEWTQAAFRTLGNRDYCPAVMYDRDKVVYIGGGNDAGTHTPTAGVETIDLAAQPLQWRRTGSMTFPRRQHNATVLPDGTVLVTGGTRGGGGANNGFNDLDAGQPVHAAEIWNPATGQWTTLSAEDVPRCYHATAVLLPDATVLSAGGGEYRPDNVVDNAPEDSHRNGQVFSPPYLFKGARPQITSAPASIHYGDQFQVVTPQAATIAKVSWVRLPSVTHSLDEHQHFTFLAFTANTNATALTVTAPASANLAPPGHYMLFVLTTTGVPSIAAVVQISTAVTPLFAPAAAAGGLASAGALTGAEAGVEATASAAAAAESESDGEDAASFALAGPPPGPPPGLVETRRADGGVRRSYLRVYAREAEVAATAKGTAVIVGITGTCPYGIGACWGGAYEALRRLEDVDLVSPIPNADDSTAELFLRDDRLPPIDLWQQQFRAIVNGTYELRGVEVTLRGVLERRNGELFLAPERGRPDVHLVPLTAGDKLQWNHSAQARKPLDPQEALAHERLVESWPHGHETHAAAAIVSVTGPLTQSPDGYALHVRQVH
jgi:hypothetical protein